MERSIRGCVETLISLFLCGDQYPARCQDTPAGIDKQIELWNFVSRNPPWRPYDQFVEKIISVISIPPWRPIANEASPAKRESWDIRASTVIGIPFERDFS
jgi:hypothetical protein